MNLEHSLDTIYEDEENALRPSHYRVSGEKVDPPLASFSVIRPIFFKRFRDKPEYALLQDDTALRSVFFALYTAYFVLSMLVWLLVLVVIIWLVFTRSEYFSTQQYFPFVLRAAKSLLHAIVYLSWGAVILVAFFGLKAVYQARLGSHMGDPAPSTVSRVVRPVGAAFCAVAYFTVIATSEDIPQGHMKLSSGKISLDIVLHVLYVFPGPLFHASVIEFWTSAMSSIIEVFRFIDEMPSSQECARCFKFVLISLLMLLLTAISFLLDILLDEKTSTILRIIPWTSGITSLVFFAGLLLDVREDVVLFFLSQRQHPVLIGFSRGSTKSSSRYHLPALRFASVDATELANPPRREQRN